MDRRFLTVLGISLVFALVVSSIFYQMTARAGSGKPSPDKTDMKDLVVANKALPVGVMVKPTDVNIIKVPAAQFPKGGFSKVEEVVDRPVISNILPEEAILDGRLAARGSGLGLAPVIPVGMRAVAVRVNDVVGVSGFVLPGMRVDVLVTGRPPSGEDTMTTTVLQNILVLSAGQNIQADAKGQAINAQTVTLLVTPEQAETLTLANNEGRIQLVLRNASDQGIESTRGRRVAELYGVKVKPKAGEGEEMPKPRPRAAAAPAAAPPVPPPVAAAKPAPPPPDEVVVIRGNTKTVEVVSNKGTNQ
jgi:pilus assembly protein CpaB